MAERKVQSKYIPPDFDHRVLRAVTGKEPKQKAKRKLESVRTMLPFNVCCSKCQSYMYRGRKFNGKKEEGVDPDYLGTKIVRFHIKCEVCSNPIVFRTDPKTAGFVVVSGARENKTTEGGFNPLAGVQEKDDNPIDNLDPIAALEAQALETQRQMKEDRELTEMLQREKDRTAALTKLLHSNQQQQQQQQQGNGYTTHEEDGALTGEEEAALRAFREKKRALELQESNEIGNGNVLPSNYVSSLSSISEVKTGSQGSEGQRGELNGPKSNHGNKTRVMDQQVDSTAVNENDDEGIVFVKRVAKKAKPTSTLSFVDYDDDDD